MKNFLEMIEYDIIAHNFFYDSKINLHFVYN